MMTDLDKAKAAFLEKVDQYLYFKNAEQTEQLLSAAKAVRGIMDHVPDNRLYDVSKAAELPRWAEVTFDHAAERIMAALEKRKV